MPVSGSNANGSWVKFPDGTLECFAELDFPNVANQAINGVFWTFPIEPAVPSDKTFFSGSPQGKLTSDPLIAKTGVGFLKSATGLGTSVYVWNHTGATQNIKVMVKMSSKWK